MWRACSLAPSSSTKMKARAPSREESPIRARAVSRRAAAVVLPASRSPARFSSLSISNSSLHRLLHRFRQLLESEGFWQECKVGLAFEVFLESVFRIAGNEHDPGLGSPPAQLAKQGRPVHFGHHDVGEHEIYAVAVLLVYPQGSFAGIGLEHMIAARSQGPRGKSPDRVFVLDEKHGSLSRQVLFLRLGISQLGGLVLLAGLLVVTRQINAEFGALAHF